MLTVLRPAAVYGERDRLLTLRLQALVNRALVPLVGDGRNTLPLVYAGNVAAAVERCLDRPPERSPRTYDLGLDHALTQEHLLAGMARALGRSPRYVRLPAALVRTCARLSERFGLTVPGAGDLSFTRFVRLALDENPFASRRIRRELDWTPPFGHDEGLSRTAAWLTRERALQRNPRPAAG
jgi:nucleoside-diphosphate-sugar epimerase